MIWRLLITAGAEGDLNKIPETDSKRIKEELYALADEPHPKSYVKKDKGALTQSPILFSCWAVSSDSHHRGQYNDSHPGRGRKPK